MSLASKLGLELGQKSVIFVGTPEISNLVTSDNEPYYIAKLKNEVTVRCSTNPDIEPMIVDEAYVRESALKLDWTFVNEAKPEEGFFIPDWKLDFSTNQGIVIYQDETIRAWSKKQRGTRKAESTSRINTGIRERMAKRAEKKAGS